MRRGLLFRVVTRLFAAFFLIQTFVSPGGPTAFTTAFPFSPSESATYARNVACCMTERLSPCPAGCLLPLRSIFRWVDTAMFYLDSAPTEIGYPLTRMRKGMAKPHYKAREVA